MLLNNFSLAFGASLVAYLAYLFGRFIADLVDEAHDEVMDFLRAEFLGGVRLILIPMQIEARVDLPPDTKDLFLERIGGMREATEQGTAQMIELRALNNRFARLSASFVRATRHALAAARTISQGLTQGRTEWQAAAAVWSQQTTAFSATATSLDRTVRNSRSGR